MHEKRPALPCIIHSFHMSTMLHRFWCLWALYLAPLFCCNKDGRSKDKAHYNTKHTGGISTTQTQQTQTRTKVTFRLSPSPSLSTPVPSSSYCDCHRHHRRRYRHSLPRQEKRIASYSITSCWHTTFRPFEIIQLHNLPFS